MMVEQPRKRKISTPDFTWNGSRCISRGRWHAAVVKTQCSTLSYKQIKK